MRYTVRVSRVQVIGTIWMPSVTCAMDYTLSSFDLEQMAGDGPITRDDVEQWLATHSGDFQCIEDFSASLEVGAETLDFPWSSEESELTYNDCMFGGEE